MAVAQLTSAEQFCVQSRSRQDRCKNPLLQDLPHKAHPESSLDKPLHSGNPELGARRPQYSNNYTTAQSLAVHTSHKLPNISDTWLASQLRPTSAKVDHSRRRSAKLVNTHRNGFTSPHRPRPKCSTTRSKHMSGPNSEIGRNPKAGPEPKSSESQKLVYIRNRSNRLPESTKASRTSARATTHGDTSQSPRACASTWAQTARSTSAEWRPSAWPRRLWLMACPPMKTMSSFVCPWPPKAQRTASSWRDGQTSLAACCVAADDVAAFRLAKLALIVKRVVWLTKNPRRRPRRGARATSAPGGAAAASAGPAG